jgi:hypothetical protein
MIAISAAAAISTRCVNFFIISSSFRGSSDPFAGERLEIREIWRPLTLCQYVLAGRQDQCFGDVSTVFSCLLTRRAGRNLRPRPSCEVVAGNGRRRRGEEEGPRPHRAAARRRAAAVGGIRGLALRGLPAPRLRHGVVVGCRQLHARRGPSRSAGQAAGLAASRKAASARASRKSHTAVLSSRRLASDRSRFFLRSVVLKLSAGHRSVGLQLQYRFVV